ncbi:hypothetical protein [Adhaeribacter soli]|uniref:HEAT repeat domain-containing protein n=1 Tax=Adhaeribacter soli TaxID=2607655 RepID=A0A5N1J517_9BACT|nr:hypothetical protein [Adhaeribacter soli]KAA9345794.1 hypothetical protein F0P94_01535 [Adhaeribacter soli]
MDNIISGIRVSQRVVLVTTKETGITLSSSKMLSENWVEKFTVSLDDSEKIERVRISDVLIKEKVSVQDYFKRLIRDIQSPDERTREYASEVLCNFIEFNSAGFDLNLLKSGVESIVKQLRTEKNSDVELKLAEGLFEFVWYGQLQMEEEISLLERLTEIDSFHIWNYMNDEDYMKISKVKQYIEMNKNKWQSRYDNIYKK